jgi:hypothetical protein
MTLITPHSTENCPQAHAACKQAVKDVFAILGVDVDDPEKVENFRKSLRFGDSLYRISGQGLGAVVVAVSGIIVAKALGWM